jgi:hypothetical protein
MANNNKPAPNNGGTIVPNTGRNLPNMHVKTPMPPVKTPKSSSVIIKKTANKNFKRKKYSWLFSL